jgi:NAD kinase
VKKYDRRIIVVTRETRLEKVLMSQNTRGQARFYINSLGGDFDDYDEEDRQYRDSVREARQRMEGLGNLQVLDRKYLPNFIFAPDDLVVVIGQDGLVANTLKYLDGQPVVGINPDPARWDGVLLPFTPKDAARIVEDSFRGRRKTAEVSMAMARLQNGQALLAVNDFFIGQRSHVSARYIIKHGGRTEPQSSSGVIVSTGLGATGWMKSVIAGASRISSLSGYPHGEQEGESPAGAARQGEQGRGLPRSSGVIRQWKREELVFAVREPFPSKTTGATLVFGAVLPDEPLRIESLMGENGVIFSDGMESDFLAFNSGAEAVIGLADKRGHIVM